MRVFSTLPKPYFKTNYGAAYLGDAEVLLKRVPDESINLVLTSPPFALTRQKEYGNKEAHEYVEWFMSLAPDLKRILKRDGSFILDLGGAYLPGMPVRTLYQYELLIDLCNKTGFYLAQEFFHYNPARLPAPAEWVNVRRIRVKDSVNVVWWLTVIPTPKADNRKVLKPYSRSMRQLLENGYKAKLRPSGHDISEKFSKEHKGAIPPNLLSLANTESNSKYLRLCRERGIKPHPARFPGAFPRFFVKFLTDPGDIVLDPFAGSNTTGAVAEKLGREWIAFDINEEYLVGSKLRFEVEYNLFNAKSNGKTPKAGTAKSSS